MKPLLNIRSVNIAIEHKVTRASLQYKSTPPGVNVTRQKGAQNIQRTPAKVKLDTTEARASIGMKSTPRSIGDFAQEGRQAALEATRNFAEEGNQIMDSHGKGSPVADIAMSKSIKTYETVLTYLPSTGPEIEVDPGSISFDYTMDKLTFDWNLNNKPFLEYVPGNIEFQVTQYPEVIIEYVGDPIYVPPSANPDYVAPPSVDAEA